MTDAVALNRRRLGAVEITRIEERIIPEPTTLFPDWRPEVLEEHGHWMVPTCFEPAGGTFLASIHSWLIRTRHHCILVDTCAGNHKERSLSPRFHQLDTPYLLRLSATGIAPEEIDYVLCTHLHVDHAGWNTRLVDGRWVPTFPNAKYVFARSERERWDPKLGAKGAPQASQQLYRDSVLPIVAAGQALQVDGGLVIDDELQIMPTPGHTPGHLSLRLRSGTSEAMFTGDIMHQPIQVFYPEWNSRFCEDQTKARATRRHMLEHCAEHGSLMLPAHFGAPHAGRVTRKGDGFAWSFEGP